MRKIKILRTTDTVNCKLTGTSRPSAACRSCEFCLAYVPYAHVICKKGANKDKYIDKI